MRFEPFKFLTSQRSLTARAWRRLVLVVMGVVTFCTMQTAVHADHAAPPLLNSPELAQLSQSNLHTSVDVRKLWQSTLIGVKDMPSGQASEPDSLWYLPDAEFKPVALSNQLKLVAGQRLVARLNMNSTGFGPSMSLVFEMPRLDAVHVSYRYDQGPWTTASAGDTLAMKAWAYSDRQPTFDIPLRPGNLNVVAEVAHIGLFDANIALESASVFRGDRMEDGLRIGLLTGLNLLLAIIGVAAALSFRRWGFLSITLMTLLVSGMTLANSGIAGLYLWTDSTTFNDEIKYVTAAVWCALFPWVTAIALSVRLRAPWWWRLALVWAAVGLMLAVLLKSNALRAEYVLLIPLIALASIAAAWLLLFQALVRRQPHAPSCVLPVLLYTVSLLIPMAGYTGFLPNDNSYSASGATTVASAMLFLQVLVRQYRQGRMVLSRAQSSPGRDVLTGLLSRKGFERMLLRTVARMKSEQTYAAFYYIQVSDAATLKERYGDEGFEGGMVQLAAAISSSISVVDTVGRVAPNAFAVTVLMPHDAKLANRLSQKILTRTMTLASHGAPLAQTARIAVAWMPMFGITLPDLERRAARALSKLESTKRITWVGGELAQVQASQLQDGLTNPTTKPFNGFAADNELPSLPGVINQIEREMLGPDSLALQPDADRLMRQLKARNSV